MKSLTGNLSLPNITSKFIEDLIKQNAKSPLPRKSLKRSSYNKNMQHLTARNTNRYTQGDESMDKCQSSKNHSQILDVTSPFYKRIHIKKVKNARCQCHQLDGSHSLSLPKIKRSTCHQHQQIITKRITDKKKYHQNLINSVKQNHMKIHQQIEYNQNKYVIQSLYKKGQILAQKYVESKINEQYNQLKLEKLKFEENKQKELIKVMLKDKLEQIYNLDNKNITFEEILEKRSEWYKQEKICAFKILNIIHSELKQVRKTKQKIQESNNKKDLTQIIQNQNILLDIQRSLAVILNNVQSIDELVIKGSVENINPQIQQIFYKNLEVKDRLYSRKLCKKLSQIVQKFYVPSRKDERPTQVSENYQAYEEKIQEAKTILPQKEETAKNSNIVKQEKVVYQVDLKNISQLQTPSKETQKTHQSTPPQSKNTPNQEETTIKKIYSTKKQKKSKVSIKSITSKQSLSSKRSETQSKAFISNAIMNKKQSKNSIHFELKQNTASNPHTQRSSKSQKSQVSIKSIRSSYHGNQISANSIKETENIKFSLIYNPKVITPFIIPSVSKQVINEIDEFIVAQDDDFDWDNEDEYVREKALKFLKFRKATKQQEIQQQNQRIEYAIEYIKARIKIRKQKNKFIIPKKYQKIQYQNFCPQKTFAYIASMIDEFQGQKKFTFLYGQLRLNQKILDDEYISGVIQTFKQMFKDSEQFEQWKDYLFEQRNKVIFIKLDRMIDLGMKEIVDFQFAEETNDIKNLQQWMKERIVFNKVDESQIAYENFIQKMGRQKEKQKLTVLTTVRDSKDEEKKKTINEAEVVMNGEKEEKLKENTAERIRNEKRKETFKETIIGQISQKSIKQGIQQISTKTIRYTIVENQRSIKIKKNGIAKLNKRYKTQDQNKLGDQDKKKVLKYMLQKKPQQYEDFAKDVNEFSNYLKEGFDQEGQEINEEIGEGN